MVTEADIIKLYGKPGQPKIKFTMPMLEEMTKNKEMLGKFRRTIKQIKPKLQTISN